MRGLASLRSEGGHLPAGMVVSMGQHDAQFQQHTHPMSLDRKSFALYSKSFPTGYRKSSDSIILPRESLL